MKKIYSIILCLFIIGNVAGQTKNITGVVKDQGGEVLIGVSVSVKNTTTGVMTDVDGKFTINIPNNVSSLTFSYVGYETQDVPVSANMSVILKESSQALKEVVVTGMTQTDRRLFTGATDKLDANTVKLDGVADISRALEGRSAGVSVQNVSGTFGTAPKIRIRGATSIYGSSKPLWVVDGVIMDDIVDVGADNLSSGDAETLISSAIAGLNADDIESFQILKDGSATSIYGAKAMAGVIVVTTKKGRPGVSSINYTGEFSTRLVPSYRNFNIMNSQEQMGIYKELKNKGWLNLAETARAQESGVYGKMYQLINTYDPQTGRFGLENTPEAMYKYLRGAEMRNTDWFDELFSMNVMHNHSVSISSGTAKSQTHVSLSAMFDPGWYKQSSANRYTANLNTTYNILDNLSVNLISNGSYRKQKAPGTLAQDVDVVNGQVKRDFDINPYSYALNSSRALDPNVYYTSNYAPFNILNELENNNIELNVTDLKFQGEMKWTAIPELQLGILGSMVYRASSQEHRIRDNSNQALAYRAMDDATIRDRNPYLYTDTDNPYALPISVLPQGGIYQRTDRKMLSYNFRASATWNKTFNNSHITNFYGGMETSSMDRNKTWFNGWGLEYSMGEIPFYVYQFFKQGIEQNRNYYDLTNERTRQASFFGTAIYSYRGKYSLNLTGRYEGSNQLGKSRSARWLPTWNVSGGWNVHEEDFFKKFSPTLSHLSLRASYSLTGNSPSYGVSNSLIVLNSYKPYRPFSNVAESGLNIIELENSELTYEKKHELNIGADMGFLDNRINLQVDWFTRNNYDLIGPINTQGVGGTTIKLANVADMKSSGVEFTLSTKNIVTPDFKWNTDFTFAHNKVEVTKLKARSRVIDLISGMGFAMEGYANRGLFSYHFNGLDKNGMPTFLGANGKEINAGNAADIDLQLRDNVDFLKYEGSTDPTYSGGFGNIFTYKNFRLNVFITYSMGNVIRLDPVFRDEYTDLSAMPREFADRWTLSGDEQRTNIPVILNIRQTEANTYLQRLYNIYNYSDARIAKGDFIRMKEMSLTYDFPKSLIGKSINNLSLKLQATNLFLLYCDSKLNGQDPEFIRAGGVSAPMAKQFTLTLRIGL
ncbi:MAG: SusC/RagA family TonB-linked outer membrane protein [Prevotella sp.]|jgi:TonB-linked SusC/RagA family outer membrane protein|nr:SusC/RagA family TonB-linked outer membrane protein [Prevotella sp.]